MPRDPKTTADATAGGPDPATVALSPEKLPYNKPALTVYGSVADLTRSGTGTVPDFLFARRRRRNSDRRLKENIVRIGSHPIGFGLYLFDYKPHLREYCGHGRQFGVMADEVEALAPEVVATDRRLSGAWLMAGVSSRRPEEPQARFHTASPRAQTNLGGSPFRTTYLPDGQTSAEFYRDGAGYVLRFPDLADFFLSADARELTGVPVPGVSEATLRHLYHNQALPLTASHHGQLVFHAGAVEIDDGAVALMGESGRGKSTLVAGLAARGFRFLTDDALLLAPQDDAFHAAPGQRSIRLWADSRSALGLSDAVADAPVQFTSKARLSGALWPYCEAPRPLRAAFVLGDSAPRVVCRALSPREALVQWVSHSFLLDTQDHALIDAHFGRVAALAARAPCFRLDYPRHFAALDDVVAAILSHARDAKP